ncbi:MAG: hypothetical protein HY360_24355 [Verrucomicrobia bacterium]|nr:hypothetical protein [Verrucomicrobiota bacterium]
MDLASHTGDVSHVGRRVPVRVVYFSTWVDGLWDAKPYLEALPGMDLTRCVINSSNEVMMRRARLNCDWDGECLRVLAFLSHPSLRFLPAQIADPIGLLALLKNPPMSGVERWLVFTGQQPTLIESSVGPFLKLFTAQGGKVLYWAFDEASRRMKCFAGSVAPYLSVLIHDEDPLAPEIEQILPSDCRRLQHSWVSNTLPFSFPFQEEVEDRIIFLGSAIGMTPNRVYQIAALQTHFKERFEAIFDYSVRVSDRARFGRLKVHLCPEGRMFGTYGMRLSHTDRPFWAGCVGQVPVVEDSHWGGRLENLYQAGLIVRYPHTNVAAMIAACERALTIGVAERRRMYEHFNAHETVGAIVARMIAEYYLCRSMPKSQNSGELHSNPLRTQGTEGNADGSGNQA